ncbi:carbon-nitrogen hydrolase family protein [Pseudomonas sp. 10B1]|uniref:carbon-nitrogen hydrolase family protein n=1 Tax=unclassified Pseudomonas TaxID=196821 RepID=UPI002AB43C13|nr:MULTISPECIES: carbon-nitrogen hydrolase family protein [unclassified Pseudomonas]MDY7560143.1 carbon-nitrogen hydrolase family protein [Pseudomonas sp. AB6]MEA9975689.1 carbon-nitrogen hydrolase family protein [Pseudomonas sp. RTS4]MEA9996704.1 carbon-nitrogen hydrolase family protein [Pseudomonas sp. AA4]MEB0085496.1 carbon-nitrogen hydrolase family protein [Pseudomonas sp. RTI1]MEB0124558.1 carbon-nitrogen hydrolase family protein [Pseudomonas sp. CCC1.2]
MGVRVIAAAQSVSVPGDIDANIQRHLVFMRAAIEQGVEFLLFPELSLTGYERGLACELAIDPADARLQPLHELAHSGGMVTVIGAPIRRAGSVDVLIAALVLGVAVEVGVYSKQHLHAGEELVFKPGEGGDGVQIDTDYLVLAVCADFTHASHANAAAQSGATVYAASVLISADGYVADTRLLASYAAEHGMAVLMANHGSATGGWISAGRSAFWSGDGIGFGAADGSGDLLLIASRDGDRWVTRIVPIMV